MSGGAPGRRGLFWILVAASVLTSIGSVPYLVSLLEQIPRGEGRLLETRGALPYLATAIQGLILTTPTAWVGLWLGPRVGLARMKPPAGRSAWVGVWAGLAVGVGLLVLSPVLPEIAPKFPFQPAEWWKGLLASASAGVNEEIWFRLGVMTAIVAGVMALVRGRPPVVRPVEGAGAGPLAAPGSPIDHAPPIDHASPAGVASYAGPAPIDATSVVRVPAGLLWTANAVAALLFGTLHLPQADLIAGISPPVIAFVLIGNGIAGMAFGWLYWKRGLITAMVAHFSTDIVLHVIAPLAVP